MTPRRLLGRSREMAALRDLLGRAAQHGGTLLLKGPAGIGKSALLDAAERDAVGLGMPAVRVTGVQAETNLPFAGLHQLLQPFLTGLDDLPTPQRQAVSTVFALIDAPPPDPFLIALGTLGLLARAADTAPVLLIVDDAQWLDAPTGQVLAFVARRLTRDRIVLLVAVRDRYPVPFLEDVGVPELRLDPLPATDAALLLDAVAPALTRSVRARLLQEAAGNPLALLELPAAWERRPPGAAALPTWSPLTTRLEQSFGARAVDLPELTRTLLLLAAVNDEDSIAEILESAARLGVPATVADLVPAADAGLLRCDQKRLVFRHPLVRSAIYQAASPAQRRAAHAALAAVLNAYPDRRAWHRAAAAPGHDDRVAEELDAAARRAHRRGGAQTALAAWERAAQLSADAAVRAAHLLRAAELAVDLGRADAVASLLKRATEASPTGHDASRLAWIRALVDLSTGRVDRIGGALDAIERASFEKDTALALRLLRAAAAHYYWADPNGIDRSVVIATVDRLGLDADDPQRLAILALTAPLEYAGEVLDRLGRISASNQPDPVSAMSLGDAAIAVGGYDLTEPFYAEAITGLRQHCQYGLLVHALTGQSWVHTYLSRWESAVAHAAEAVAVAEELGQPHFTTLAQAPLRLIAALRGDVEPAGDGEPLPPGLAGAGTVLVRGAAALTAGRYAEAYRHLRTIVDPASARHYPMMGFAAVGYLAEAAVHSGQIEQGRADAAALLAFGSGSVAGKIRQDLAFARAVLADNADAEEAFADALSPGSETWPFDKARAQLAYGEWLRRQRRLVDSREPLRAARRTFEELGAEPWAERARRELRGAGERVRIGGAGGQAVLTAQELQVARLAAEGHSNRQIAELLFLSPRTVGSHLYRLFPKIGVASRADLAAALEEGGWTSGPVSVPR
ncbi:AAA family ATPase [Micromonospora thermarum]|uniref:AAA family ATPase n=1 Tax=Micromonospora thermarum TaxID=2720024 RepID=A0ABX0Z3N5_9ACTN|nr:LuxR family transcriptional regulator [Micromonospora thermarum]NJP31929.1 AAA family ATPase [Micromonospora thermarum]